MALKEKQGIASFVQLRLQQGFNYEEVYEDLYKANEAFRLNSKTKLAKSLKQKNDTPRTGHIEWLLKNIWNNWDGSGHLPCLLARVAKCI